MAPSIEQPAWTGPTALLPTVDSPALVRPYLATVGGPCRWCRRPILRSPGQLWLHTDLKAGCTDRWGWTITGWLAEPVPPTP